MKSCTLLSVLLVLCSCPALLAQETPRYFPLDEGNVWSFGFSDEYIDRWEIIVLAREGDTALVRYQRIELSLGFISGPSDFRFRERGLDIDIDLGEGFIPFYRFDGAAFVHRDFRECNDELVAAAFPAEMPITTPAGTFDGCLHLAYQERHCSHAGQVLEDFCQGIGLVGWTDPVSAWHLAERAPTDKPFLRGDANMDGDVNIADPLKTFGVLFLGEGFFYCADAADANDDGEVNVSDGIFALSFLFLGERSPPEPGHEECGFDPTEDETKCASYEPCLPKIGG